MTILVTGFDAFGGRSGNAAADVCAALPPAFKGEAVETRTLPTSFARAFAILADAIDAARPRLVLCLGEAGGRTVVTPERGARNRILAAIPDNDGAMPEACPIIAGGPEYLAARHDLARCLAALAASGIGAALSDDAGGFVCNATFYRLLHACAVGRWRGMAAGFIHLPADWAGDRRLVAGGVRAVGAAIGAAARPS